MLQRIASICGSSEGESGGESGILWAGHWHSVNGNTGCDSMGDHQNVPDASNPVWRGSTSQPTVGDQKNHRCDRNTFRYMV
jgi:hypothetical protein